MKMIGKGAFSKVYDQGDGSVLIKSRCYQKEAFAYGVGKHSPLFPKLERVDGGTYTMKKYDKVRGVKKHVSKHQWGLYQWLRKEYSHTCMSGYNQIRRVLEGMPAKFRKEKEDVLDVLDELANYGEDISFEISPRNVAIDGGKLVLLDCFFFSSLLD